MAPTKYFVKVPQVGRFMPLVGGFRRPVESPLDPAINLYTSLVDFIYFGRLVEPALYPQTFKQIVSPIVEQISGKIVGLTIKASKLPKL